MQESLNNLTDTSLVEVSCCQDGKLISKTCGLQEKDSFLPCNTICGNTTIESKQLLKHASIFYYYYYVSVISMHTKLFN